MVKYEAVLTIGEDVPDGSTIYVYMSKLLIADKDEFKKDVSVIDGVVLSNRKLNSMGYRYFLNAGKSKGCLLLFKKSESYKSYYEVF